MPVTTLRTGEKLTDTSRCADCMLCCRPEQKKSIYNKRYYSENREKIRTRQAQYYVENKEEILTLRKAYYQQNREKILTKTKIHRKRKAPKKEKPQQRPKKSREEILAAKKKHYQENKEKILADRKKYYLKNREKILACHRHNYHNHPAKKEKIINWRKNRIKIKRCRQCNRRLLTLQSRAAGFCVGCHPPQTWGKVHNFRSEPRILIAPPSIAEYP